MPAIPTDKIPVISIVLLSLHRMDETRRCINSIERFTKLPFEIIVVDMGASEDIILWLRQLSAGKPFIKTIFNNTNLGTSAGRNQGIGIAQGDYIVFLDNDTEVTECWLEPLIQQAESNEKLAACGSKVISTNGKVMNCPQFAKATFVDGRIKTIGVEFTQHYYSDQPEVNVNEEVAWFPTTSLLIKKSVLVEIGGFDENIFLCEEDKDLCLRLSYAGYKIMYVPQSVVYHHHGKATAEYSGIRNNMPILMKDVKYFEKKWDCKVFIRHSRTYLHTSGYDDPDIDKIKKFSFFNTILEEELNLKEMILTVTSRCNHRCGMCYYHENLNQPVNELSLDEYRKIAASLPVLNILWISGGEPFLRNDLAEICSVFCETNKTNNIFLPTNGSNPDKIRQITENILLQNPEVRLSVMFSLEGLADLHDKIHGKTGAFASVEESIRKLLLLRFRLKRNNISFSILLNSVLTTQNLHQIIPLMQYVKEHLRVDSHTFTPMRGEGHDKNHQPPGGLELKNLYKQALPNFNFYAEKARLTPEKLREYNLWIEKRYNLWADVLNGQELPFTCQAGNLIGVLDPDGGIKICEAKCQVANIRDYNYDFRKAWFSMKADQSRETKKGCSCTHACFINISENFNVNKHE